MVFLTSGVVGIVEVGRHAKQVVQKGAGLKFALTNTVDSALPPGDDHPYRTGVWQAQVNEFDAWDMDVIGEIPEDLNGVYLRNTETALFEPIKRYHPFDGDALIHSISFEAGQARYSNRFVRTDGFLAEQKAKQSLWAGITEHPSNAVAETGWGARTMMKDNASTDVIVHRGRGVGELLSMWRAVRARSPDPPIAG